MTKSAQVKSTNVRFQISAARLAFRTLELLAPSLGARIAEPMWFRVPTGRRGPNGARFTRTRSSRTRSHPLASVDATGTPFRVRSQGHVVRGLFWGHGPVVYLLPGWGGTIAQMRSLVGPLVDTGHRVVVHDAPSHGRSDAGVSGPGRANAVEMGRSLEAVVARFGAPRAIVTHSMGALATMLALREGWVTCERLVLIAPVSGIPDLSELFRSRLGFGERTKSRIEKRAHRRVGYPVAELDVGWLSRAIHRPQLFVVHDEHDQETSYAASADLVGSWPGARLLSTSGLGHRRILRDAGVTQAVSWFVTHGLVAIDLGDEAIAEESVSEESVSDEAIGEESETLARVEDPGRIEGVLDRAMNVHHV